MLCPNLNKSIKEMTQAYNSVLKVDRYANVFDSLRIYKLVPDLDWLITLRDRVSKITNSSRYWVEDRPISWSNIIYQFNSYNNSFQVFAKEAQHIETRDEWILFLSNMKAELESALTVTSKSVENLKENFKNVEKYQRLLEASIDEGWKAVDDEEKAVNELYGQLAAFQSKLDSLQGKLNSDVFSEGIGISKAVVSVTYKVLIAGAGSVPFLGLAGLAFTVGKSFYELFAESKEITDMIEKIGKTKIKLSAESQALAITKVMLKSLYNLKSEFQEAKVKIEHIEDIWDIEYNKVHACLGFIEAGGDPNKVPELMSIRAARATWDTLDKITKRMLTTSEINEPIQINVPGGLVKKPIKFNLN